MNDSTDPICDSLFQKRRSGGYERQLGLSQNCSQLCVLESYYIFTSLYPSKPSTEWVEMVYREKRWRNVQAETCQGRWCLNLTLIFSLLSSWHSTESSLSHSHHCPCSHFLYYLLQCTFKLPLIYRWANWGWEVKWLAQVYTTNKRDRIKNGPRGYSSGWAEGRKLKWNACLLALISSMK